MTPFAISASRSASTFWSGWSRGSRSTTQLLLLSAAVCVAIFTKYTAFIILPVVFFTIFSLAWRHLNFGALVFRTVTVLAAPLVLLAAYCVHNEINEGVALPFNTDSQIPPRRNRTIQADTIL